MESNKTVIANLKAIISEYHAWCDETDLFRSILIIQKSALDEEPESIHHPVLFQDYCTFEDATCYCEE